jgi:peptidoglycan/LPS O-acetylase OafA/YrhL
VLFFFALSGFLVGGPAFKKIRAVEWDAADYAVHRFTRLWTTLIPALLLTAALDLAGRDWLHLRGYAGEYWELILNGAPNDATAVLSIPAFLCNIAFLQTIIGPVFGSNGPLWSLANEFWYYFVIPFGWLALRGGVATGWRLAAGAFTLAGCLLLPSGIVAMGGIWLAGAVTSLLAPRLAALSPRRRIALTLFFALATVAALPAAHFGQDIFTDIALGLCCAALLPYLAAMPAFGGIYGRVAFGLSEISFTLYVVHFPLLALLWFGLLAPEQFALGATGILIWLAMIAAALLLAIAMWWLFERNTGRVRRWAQRVLLGRK